MRKLCAALVVMAVVGAGALFAWPQAPARAVAREAVALVTPRAPAPSAPLRHPQSPPPAALPAPRPVAAAQAERAASEQRGSYGRPPAPSSELQRKQRIRQTEYYSGRVVQLERLRDSARAAGKESEVAALESALGRARSRLQLLAAQGEADRASATEQ